MVTQPRPLHSLQLSHGAVPLATAYNLSPSGAVEDNSLQPLRRSDTTSSDS